MHDTTVRRIGDLPILDWDVVLFVSRRPPPGSAGLAVAAPAGKPTVGASHRAPEAFSPGHPGPLPPPAAHQRARGHEQPHQGRQAHGLWFPGGYRVLLPEVPCCLPGRSMMNPTSFGRVYSLLCEIVLILRNRFPISILSKSSIQR